MEEVVPKAPLDSEVNIKDVMNAVPVMRGGDIFDDGKNRFWTTSGTGRKVRTIQKEMEKRENDSDKLNSLDFWAGSLPVEFLADIFDGSFARYSCPVCQREL